MLKRKALMESISSNLQDFLKRIGNNLSVPDKKFLRDSFVGLIRCGKPIVCQMARHTTSTVLWDGELKEICPNASFFSKFSSFYLPKKMVIC